MTLADDVRSWHRRTFWSIAGASAHDPELLFVLG